jgi:anti-sigma regulatory factor (Ser/Thr protein kinase)
LQISHDGRYGISLTFPGDIDYIPAIRKFVAEMLQAANFSPKFSYRSEIVVDEICYNAITYGCQSSDAQVTLLFDIHRDRIELVIKDPGKGESVDRDRLKRAVEGKLAEEAEPDTQGAKREKLGLEIVKMLSEELDFEIDKNNLTSVRVVRRREDAEVSQPT